MKEFQTIIKKIQEDVSYTIYNDKTQLTREETLRHRNRMIGVWRKHLSKRKQQFWHGMNCEKTAVICETWNSDDKKILPKKFLLKFIPNESVEAKNIRRVSTFEKFQAETNLLKLRAKNHNTKAKQIDQEMNAFLQSKFKDEHLNNLKDLGVEETMAEEYKSSKRWDSKQRWLEKYAAELNNNDFTRPKWERIETYTRSQPWKNQRYFIGKSAHDNHWKRQPRAKMSQTNRERFRHKQDVHRRAKEHFTERSNKGFQYEQREQLPAKRKATYKKIPPSTRRATYAEIANRQPG